MLNPAKSRLACFIATLGPVGFLPVAPGTWGSGAAMVVWFFGLGKVDFTWQITAICILLPIAIWSATVAEKRLGHDAHPIVIDEVVGQWITLLVAGNQLLWVAAGFVVFRVFDVWKPFPVKQSQKFPGGYGIVIDDVLAGAYSVAIIWLGREYIHG